MNVDEMEAMLAAWERDLALAQDDNRAFDRALGADVRREPTEHAEAKIAQHLAKFNVIEAAVKDAAGKTWACAQEQKAVSLQVEAAVARLRDGDPAAAGEAERLLAQFDRLQARFERHTADQERLMALFGRVCAATTKLRESMEAWWNAEGDEDEDQDGQDD
jgi:hypothetical protein